MNLQKIMILNTLKGIFPGVVKLLINLETMTMIIETAHGVREEPAKGAEYFAQVCEAYSLKTLNTIFIDFTKKDIVLRGLPMDGTETKDILI